MYFILKLEISLVYLNCFVVSCDILVLLRQELFLVVKVWFLFIVFWMEDKMESFLLKWRTISIMHN